MSYLDYIAYLLTPKYVVYVPAVIGLCAVLNAVLPQPPAGSPWVKARQLLALVGAQWLWATALIKPGSSEATFLRQRGQTPKEVVSVSLGVDPVKTKKPTFQHPLDYTILVIMVAMALTLSACAVYVPDDGPGFGPGFGPPHDWHGDHGDWHGDHGWRQ